MSSSHPTITVGRLRQELELYPDDFELSFSGLTFYRVKTRGPDLVQIEFNEYRIAEDEKTITLGKSPFSEGKGPE